MKRLLMMLLVIGLPVSFVVGSATKASKQARLRAVDSLTALDTVETTLRTDADTSDAWNVMDMTKLSFVYATEHDTNFVNDTVGFILEYSVDLTDANLWTLLDTIKVSLATDTSYSDVWYSLDSLPPMNYIRFILYHKDALESSADNVGLFENTYNFDGYVWLKGWK